MTIGSLMSLILDLTFSYKNCYFSLCLHSSIYNYKPVSTKLGQTIQGHKVLCEFDVGVVGPEQLELFALECLHFSIYKYQPIGSKFGQNKYDSLRSHVSLTKSVIGLEQVELFALELESSLE